MTQNTDADDALVASLVAQLRTARQAERDLFGGLDPTLRDLPMRPGNWSPKDHQAHLTAWKDRQAARIRAVREGQQFPTDDREDDVINAELQSARADWAWEEVVAEADEVSARLESEVRAAGSGLRQFESGRLVSGIFGNGPFHAATHFGWLVEGDVGFDAIAVEAFLDAEAQLLDTTALSDADRGTGVYNLACAHALAGRLDQARPLLRDAFRLRPDLAEFAKEDPDLVALREELAGLAARPSSA
ncbi:MAG: DinB family protein [Chloroflexota bacterium]